LSAEHQLSDPQAIVQRLLLEEIARIVQSARDNGDTLRAGYHAGLLADAYPHAFSIGRIIDELILAATREGVSIEIGRPDGTKPHF
jgi:hypothetical protein